MSEASQGRSSTNAPSAGSQTQRAGERVRFRRAITLSLMTLVLPGSAQVVMGNKRVGRIAIRVWAVSVAVLAVFVIVSLLSRPLMFALITNPRLLFIAKWFLILGALAWVLLLLDAWRLGRPLQLTQGHRLFSTGVNAVLCFVIAGVMFFGANLVSVQTGFMDTVFAAQATTKPSDGRYNILLMGTDSGKGRAGTRPDSLQVASVDAETGRTVLIGLPRNLQDVPFPSGSVMDREFPNGFDCDDCYLNAVHTWASDNSDKFSSKDPGIQATIGAVEEITGLEISYYAVATMSGFSKLIDAVGGVEVNVRERTPIDGIGSPISGYIEPGIQRLDGKEALWFARSRVVSDDFSRMGRQKCLMSAMASQLDPKSVLFNVEEIAESGKSLLTTNIPASDLDVFMELALRARGQKISSVSLTPPAIYTGNPDYPKVRRMIDDAIQKAEGTAPKPYGLDRAKLPPLKAPDPLAPAKDSKRVNQSSDVSAAC